MERAVESDRSFRFEFFFDRVVFPSPGYVNNSGKETVKET